MDLNEYQKLAAATLGPDRDVLLLTLGVCGEAGEVAELIKKGHRPGRTVDVDHLKEELGDVAWYLAVLADTYHLTLEDVLQYNIEKLRKRYG